MANIWRRFPSSRISGEDLQKKSPLSAESVVVGGFFEAPAGGPATITGTLAATDAPDTAAFVGDVAHVGTLAATDSADTAAFAGDIAHVGTLAATDGADTAAFAGDIDHAGTLAATDGADTFVADGTVTSGAATITGDLAATDDGDTAAMDGVVATPTETTPKYSGLGYLVDDGKKRETITLYDEEAEILELLATIMPVIQGKQQRRSI